MSKNRKTRKRIPKVIKNEVWDLNIGKKNGIGSCFVCNKSIDSKHFECGHIKSRHDGGTDTTDNLRPICDLCNKSIGTMDMNDFKKKYPIPKENPDPNTLICHNQIHFKFFEVDCSWNHLNNSSSMCIYECFCKIKQPNNSLQIKTSDVDLEIFNRNIFNGHWKYLHLSSKFQNMLQVVNSHTLKKQFDQGILVYDKEKDNNNFPKLFKNVIMCVIQKDNYNS